MSTSESARIASSLPHVANTSELLEVCGPVLDGMTKYGSVMCDSCAAMGKEWLAFLDRRLQVDLAMQSRIVSCHSPLDLMREWQTFLNAAAEDYRIEFARLAALNTAASQRALAMAALKDAH